MTRPLFISVDESGGTKTSERVSVCCQFKWMGALIISRGKTCGGRNFWAVVRLSPTEMNGRLRLAVEGWVLMTNWVWVSQYFWPYSFQGAKLWGAKTFECESVCHPFLSRLSACSVTTVSWNAYKSNGTPRATPGRTDGCTRCRSARCIKLRSIHFQWLGP